MTPTALAPEPSRATTTITLSVAGLFNIPLSVYTGVEETRVVRKEFYEDPNVEGAYVAVGRASVIKDSCQIIESDKVVRMAEADPGIWVTLTDDEIAACTSPKGLAEVVTFVKRTQIGKYLVHDVKQVRPKAVKGVANPADVKAFYLLLSSMSERKVVALVRVAMRGPAQYAILDHDGSLYFVHTADQVRSARPIQGAEVSDVERSLALSLIDAVGTDTPILIDDTAVQVRQYVAAKAVGQTPVVEATPVPQVDLMAALEASIAAAKASKGVKV